jgi:hypothetical protein
MSLPTLGQFLTKLASNPSEATAFDNCRPDLSRRQHCQLVLSQAENSCANVAESKRLQAARAANSSLKSSLEKATARIRFLTPEAIVRHNLHAAFGKKLPVGPAKPTKAVAQAAIAAKKTAPSAAAKPAKSCLGNTNLSKVSDFFARQAK